MSQDYDTGLNTLYAQQKQLYLSDYHINGIKEDKNTYTHPKKRFIKDLRTLLGNAKEKRQDIILTGDFNEDVGDNYNELTQLMLDMELIDFHAFKHGFDCDIATWDRGSRRLDYFFLSRRFIDHVLHCGFERFYYRLSKDHRGYFVDLSIVGLFDQKLSILFVPALRYINGDHPGNIRKYIKALFSYIQDHKLIEKALLLMNYFSPEGAKKLDKMFTTGMLAAEKRCRISYRLPWDAETHEVMMSKNIVKSLLSSLYNKIVIDDILAMKMKKLKEAFDLPATIEAAKKLLQILRKRGHNLIKSRQCNQATSYLERDKAHHMMNPGLSTSDRGTN